MTLVCDIKHGEVSIENVITERITKGKRLLCLVVFTSNILLS